MNTVYIYMITNNINGKRYVGQTRDPKSRWERHKRVSNERYISRDINKYGHQNFTFEILQEVTEDNWEEYEVYYIEKYKTFKEGYNKTLGGKGSKVITYGEDEIINTYKELGRIRKVSEELEISERTISDILHKHGVKIDKSPVNPFTEEDAIKYAEHRVHMRRGVRLPQYNKEFKSLIECAEWLVEKEIPRTSNVESVQKALSKNINEGKDKYCGVYIEDLGKRVY